MIAVALEHRTTYRFDRPIAIGPHVVRLRPAPHPRTPDRGLLAADLPGRPLHQLAAGPVRQLPGPGGLPEQGQRAGRSPSAWSPTCGDQPVRLLHRGVRRDLPVPLRQPSWPRTSQPYLDVAARRTARSWTSGSAARCRPRRRRAVRSVQFLGALNAAVHRDVAYSVRMEQGVQTPDETLTGRIGSCRDSALAAGDRAAAATASPRGSSPATSSSSTADDRALDGPSGPDRGLHRPARLGRGLRPRRRLGRARPDLGAVRRRGPHPAGRHPAPGRRARDHRGHRARPRSTIELRQHGAAGSTRTRGSPSPTADGAAGAPATARRGGRRAAARRPACG